MQSLLLYELVLLIAGAILFLALVFVLVYYVIKKEEIKNVFWFFIFPIIMMGFPSFQSFNFENGKIEIKKLTAEVKNDPKDVEKREELEKAIVSVNQARINKDAEASKYVAEAQLELGNIPESETAIQNALVLEKNDPNANAINNKIQKAKKREIQYNQNVKELHKILSEVDKKETATPMEIKKIKDILVKTEVPKYTDEKSQIVIAKSLNQIGDIESSSKVLENVLTSNPNSKAAIAVQNDTVAKNTVSNIKINATKFNRAIIRN
jgi:tetratricopeptide (TPR) repeat protein